MVLDNIRGLVRPVGFSVPDNGLVVLHHAECGLLDRFTLIELRHVMSSAWAQEESRVAEIRRLEERVRATDADTEELRVANAHVDEVTAERAPFAVGDEQAQAERDPLANRISEMDVDATTPDGELDIVIKAARHGWLEGCNYCGSSGSQDFR